MLSIQKVFGQLRHLCDDRCDVSLTTTFQQHQVRLVAPDQVFDAVAIGNYRVLNGVLFQVERVTRRLIGCQTSAEPEATVQTLIVVTRHDSTQTPYQTLEAIHLSAIDVNQSSVLCLRVGGEVNGCHQMYLGSAAVDILEESRHLSEDESLQGESARSLGFGPGLHEEALASTRLGVEVVQLVVLSQIKHLEAHHMPVEVGQTGGHGSNEVIPGMSVPIEARDG